MKRANEASEWAKERAREMKREWKYIRVHVWERWKGEKSSDNFCTTVFRAGAPRLTLLPNFCDWLYTLRSDITSVESGSRGRKVSRNKRGQGVDPRYIFFFFAQPFDFCTLALSPRKRTIFLPRKRFRIEERIEFHRAIQDSIQGAISVDRPSAIITISRLSIHCQPWDGVTDRTLDTTYVERRD